MQVFFPPRASMTRNNSALLLSKHDASKVCFDGLTAPGGLRNLQAWDLATGRSSSLPEERLKFSQIEEHRGRLQSRWNAIGVAPKQMKTWLRCLALSSLEVAGQ